MATSHHGTVALSTTNCLQGIETSCAGDGDRPGDVEPTTPICSQSIGGILSNRDTIPELLGNSSCHMRAYFHITPIE
ncbi:hypothetical protein N7537_008253 [Penicillium hordei]|uniref:Uncharacterized protein n=1 Tax=Penicillium hordei TaxID=40994 RepID=A0AAD6E0K2_9EURO|nr:uncharacterized protein N7537_008253 [Penicillium hordei]KAJ5598169.1 hypothetical protein N7537_008253 [Penicillium hordei]